jgi:SAM-dependent methyltransferase
MRENEIRPQALLDRYLELSALDAATCFDETPRQALACVACGREHTLYQFEKSGFAYGRCGFCGTLFQSPRPAIASFEAFYRNSASSKYWAEVFFPAVAEIRREKIFRPRVEQLSSILKEKGVTVARLIDVGAGFGIFLEEWRRIFPQVSALAVEPSSLLAEVCRSKGFEVVEDIVENVAGHNDSADLVTCFEVLEHVYAPLDFLNVLKSLVKPGGFVFISTLGIDGFDLQVLWEKSTQISPPHHINFLSVAGFESLFTRAGLVDVSVTTPGRLDVDIVRNFVKRDPQILEGQRFLGELLASDQKAEAFQHFLTEHRMSSHAWVIGKKPAASEK